MGGKNSVKVYDYQLSVHYAICHGPIDSINQVRIKDKRVWCGAVTERRDVCIDLPEVFGGDGKEGGVRGIVECYPGTFDQVASEPLAKRMGLTPATAPGYRGIASLFFRGMFEAGFKWVTNNPYVPSLDVSVTKLFRELNDDYAAIWPLGEPEPDMTNGWNIPLVPDGNTYEMPVILSNGITIPGIGPAEPIGSFSRISTYENVYCGVEFENPGFIQGEYYRTKVPADGDTAEPLSVTNDKRPSIEEIDAGLAHLDVFLVSEFQSNSGRVDGLGVTQYYVWFYGGETNPETGAFEPGELISTYPKFHAAVGRNSGGKNTIDRNWPIPPGTRFIRQYYGYNPWPGSSYVSTPEKTVKVNWSGLEYTHCAIAEGGMLPDANPANFLWELFINKDWGLGEDVSQMNEASFQAASQTLFNERFGISFKWMEQADGETIAKEVIDHIKALMFQDPVDARWNIKLLRDDYDIGDLTIIGPSECEITDGRRRLWSEVTNEIVVTYTDPATEESATVTAHNNAALAIQSGISSDSRNYYMVRNANLAQALADRDVAEVGYPLWSGTLRLSRKFWAVRPGAVFRLNYPDEEIEDMVIRVMTVQPGTPQDRNLVVTVVEDIFSVSHTVYRTPQDRLLPEAPQRPVPMIHQTAIALPYPMAILGGATPEQIEQNAPGQIVVPMASHPDMNPNDIEVWIHTDTELVSGFPYWRNSGRVGESEARELPFAMAEEVESVLPRELIDEMGHGFIFPGDFLMLGQGDLGSEIIRLDSFNISAQEWDVTRGMFDTIPRQWDAGTLLWRLPSSASDAIDTLFIPGLDGLDLRFLPRVAGQRLRLSEADTVFYGEVLPRLHAPIRPANCQVMNGGTGFGFAQALFETEPYPTNITVSWSNRNRLDEDALQPRWDAPSTGIEAGQTTTIRIYDLGGSLLTEYPGLTGTSHTFPAADFGPAGKGWVEFVAVHDGYESIQNARRYVRIGIAAGWGLDWGNNWG